MWAGIPLRSMRDRSVGRKGAGRSWGRSVAAMPASVLDRRIKRDRARFGQNLRRTGIDRSDIAVSVIEEFVEHALDRRLDVVRSAIAHVDMLIAGIDDRDAVLLADFVVR